HIGTERIVENLAAAWFFTKYAAALAIKAFYCRRKFGMTLHRFDFHDLCVVDVVNVDPPCSNVERVRRNFFVEPGKSRDAMPCGKHNARSDQRAAAFERVIESKTFGVVQTSSVDQCDCSIKFFLWIDGASVHDSGASDVEIERD